MRFQTAFEQFAQTTSGRLFIVCLTCLRLLLGGVVVFVGITLISDASTSWLDCGSPGCIVDDTGYLYDDNDFGQGVAGGILTVLGISMAFGLLVRPLALLGVGLVVTSAILANNHNASDIILYVVAMLLFGLFAAGGAGHIFGLDGLIYRNLRRQNGLTKFLFG